MTFVSYEFLAFLAVFVLVYYVLPGRFRWMILLAGSLLFYLASGVKYFVFLLITCISVYGLALWIEKIHTAGTEEMKKQGLKGEEKKAFRAGIKKRQKRVLQLGFCESWNFDCGKVHKLCNLECKPVAAFFWKGRGIGLCYLGFAFGHFLLYPSGFGIYSGYLPWKV